MSKNTTSNTLSSRLLQALGERGISQAELARKIGLKRQSIQYLCTSGTNKTKFAHDIAAALDINVD
jgi:DNA-binding XRE family transcriptional regulator